VEEGRQLEVRVNVNSTDPDSPPFFEDGHFIQDMVPPKVTSYSESFDSSHNLLFTVTAADATTSPVYAELWFSTDAGVIWSQLQLEPDSDILQDTSVRTFSGTAGPFAVGSTVQYFVAVEDTVSNITYFGTGQATP
jgi:hypothetical protein